MGTMTMDVAGIVNQPPSSIGKVAVTLDYNELYAFTLIDFTTGANPVFSDPESDDLENVKILTLPLIGALTINSVPAQVNDEVSSAQIIAGELEYQCDIAEVAGYNDNFTYTASDNGSSSYYSGAAGVSIVVGDNLNQPPDNVGDNLLSTNYDTDITFTVDNFTTETTPAYSDPEMDPADMLKITSLPTTGKLYDNGVEITIGDLDYIISFADIALGNLTYEPDDSNTNAYDVSFNFEIADSGSGDYTG